MKTKVPFMHNRENKILRFSRFLIGATIALAVLLSAFEWRTPFTAASQLTGEPQEPIYFEEAPPVYVIQPKEKKELFKPKKNSIESIKVSDKLEIVNNTVELKENTNLPDPRDIKPISFPEEVTVPDRDIFSPVEQMPTFPGGDIELMKFLKKNLNYPKMSKELGITGTVFVEFIVDESGEMTDIKIAKGVSSDIDKEAIRVVKMMPKWIPGSQRNQPVQVGMRLPIRFTLM